MGNPILLHLDEPSGATSFLNSGSAGGRWSASPTAPTAGVSGILNNGVSFPGTQTNYMYLIGDALSRAVEPANVTLIAWVYLLAEATGTNYVHLLSKAYYVDDEWTHGEPFVALELTVPRGALNPAYTVTAGGTRHILTGTNAFSLNAWHHICLTYDGTTLNGYLDGQPNGSLTVSAAIDYGGHGDWLAGGNFPPYFEAEVLDGSIDELAVYDTAFSPTAVFQDYITTWASHFGLGYTPPPPPPNPTVALSTLPNVSPAGTDFGTDLACLSDLDPNFTLVSGLASLGQDLAHRLETPRGSLSYDGNYGTDVRTYLNDNLDAAKLARLQAEAQAECLKDERVLTCVVQATFVQASSSLTLNIAVTTSAGPFTFVLAVSALSVTLLAQKSATA